MPRGEGFEVNAETVMNCGKQISNLQEKANQLKQDCEAAKVPQTGWGLVGQIVYQSYEDMLTKFEEHLDQIGSGIQSAGEKIAECGQGYQDDDKKAEEQMRKILNDVSGMKV